MIKLTLYLWSKLHSDQWDGLGFKIQDAWESAKEKLSYLMDHITVDRRWVDRTLVTLWCMMSISKKWQSWDSDFKPCYSSHDQVNTTPLIEDSPWSIRWITVWDPRCLGERQRSFLIWSIISWSIDAKLTEHWWHYDARCQQWSNDKVGNSGFSLITLLMTKLTLYLFKALAWLIRRIWF